MPVRNLVPNHFLNCREKKKRKKKRKKELGPGSMECISNLQQLMVAKGQTKKSNKNKIATNKNVLHSSGYAYMLVYQLMHFALSCAKGTERIPSF